MSEPRNKLQNQEQSNAKIDQLAREAIQQATPKRTAFDEAVLAAAHRQAAINRQTQAHTNGSQFSGQARGNQVSLKWWRRPVWLGAGSTVAVLATTLILTSQPEPQPGSESAGREVASSSAAETQQEALSPPKVGQRTESTPVADGASKVASVSAPMPAATPKPAPQLTPQATAQAVQRPAPLSAPTSAAAPVATSAETSTPAPAPAPAPARATAPASQLSSAPVTSNKSVDQPNRSKVEERREQKVAIADLAGAERATRPAETVTALSASTPPQLTVQTKRAADAAELDPAQCRKLITQISIDARNAENPAWAKVASNCAKRFPNEVWELYLGPVGDLKSAR
jgi:hypothetical protein